MPMSFIHLHTHSEYSLLDGANRIPDLVAHVKKLGMDSLAVTDHGNMHAAWSVLRGGARPRDPTDPRLRGLPRLRAPAGAGEAGVGAGRLQPPRPPGAEPRRLPEPGPPDLDRLHGGVLPPPADRQGGPPAHSEGHRLSRGLPVRRGGAAPAAGTLRGGQAERGMVRRVVRQRRLLARGAAARHRRGADRHRGHAPAGPGARTRRRRHERRALSPPGRRRVARRAARHRHR